VVNANGDGHIRTKEELDKLFAWWEREMQTEKPCSADPTPSDQALVKMAFGNQQSGAVTAG